MKKTILIVLLFICGGVSYVYAQSATTKPGYVEALAFGGVEKYLVYLTVTIPNQKCYNTDVGVLDPEIFAYTSAFTNLQLASIFHQKVQITVDGCIKAEDFNGCNDESINQKTFPRIVAIVFYGQKDVDK